MADTHAPMRCPQCQAMMQAGFLPVSQGMHFIKGDGRSAHHFAEDIPGTHAIMRTNRLMAWRCKGCELVVFRYGRDNAKRIERLLAESDAEQEDPAELIDEEDAQPPRRGR